LLPVSINIDDFVEKSALSKSDIKSFTGLLLDKMAGRFQEEWLSVIKENLHSTRQEYQKGMFVDRPNDNTVVFGVTARQSRLAVDLELGKSGFDEKPGFEKSKKATKGKDGSWYITVPFRHAVPGSVGESTAFSSVLPEEAYKLAKSQSTPVQLSQLPSYLQKKGVRQEFKIKNKVIPAYQHKAAKYEGLIRIVDQRENRGQYMTFRRVSNNSDPYAWFHPGFRPYGLLGKALIKTDVASVVRRARLEFLTSR
jgi:hypothetical protein